MIRVLVVDDSAVIRRGLRTLLGREPDIQVVGTAADPFEARDRIADCQPDVITLDIQMPRMDGLSFLERLMAHHPLPVVVLSSVAPERTEAAMRALELGAIEVVGKPTGPIESAAFRRVLIRAVRAAARARLHTHDSTAGADASTVPAGADASAPPAAAVPREGAPQLIALGASTGGTHAIEVVLGGFPEDAPPCVVVQHLPAPFTKSFAERLSRQCRLDVREAREGDRLHHGLALIAPGGRHMVVAPAADGGYVARLSDAPRLHHQRPAVDVLFESVAASVGPGAAAALLTGMGSDGAAGLLRIRDSGGFTVAEAEETCVIFGMPRAAMARSAACQVAPLPAIAPLLLANGRPADSGADSGADSKHPHGPGARVA